MIKDNKRTLSTYLVYAFYAAAMITMIYYAYNEQTYATHGKNSPLYKNLRECTAYIKKGFDTEDLLKMTIMQANGSVWRIRACVFPVLRWNSQNEFSFHLGETPRRSLPSIYCLRWTARQ